MMSVHDKDAEAREQPFFSSSYPGGELFIVAKGDPLVRAGAHLPTICGPRQTAFFMALPFWCYLWRCDVHDRAE